MPAFSLFPVQTKLKQALRVISTEGKRVRLFDLVQLGPGSPHSFINTSATMSSESFLIPSQKFSTLTKKPRNPSRAFNVCVWCLRGRTPE